LAPRKAPMHKTKHMYALKNKVQLIGNLGNSPEIKTFDGGRKMARFSMATNESYRNAQGERITDTQWHNLIAWGKLADIAERFLEKGKEVAVEGKLVNRSYQDREGNKRYITEIQVNELLLLGSKAAD
jgi:single-strand DNA-binding protein